MFFNPFTTKDNFVDNDIEPDVNFYLWVQCTTGVYFCRELLNGK